MKKGLLLLMLVFSMIGINGCTYFVEPVFIPLKADQLPIVKTEHPLSIGIMQNPTQDQFTVLGGFRKWVARTDAMNRYALTSLEYMLKKNNITLADNALKKLNVSVVHVDCNIHGFTWFEARIKAQAGDKLIREFTGKDFASKDLHTLASEAINNALVEMLKDKEFLQYLAE
jgi:hypothetical protein